MGDHAEHGEQITGVAVAAAGDVLGDGEHDEQHRHHAQGESPPIDPTAFAGGGAVTGRPVTATTTSPAPATHVITVSRRGQVRKSVEGDSNEW